MAATPGTRTAAAIRNDDNNDDDDDDDDNANNVGRNARNHNYPDYDRDEGSFVRSFVVSCSLWMAFLCSLGCVCAQILLVVASLGLSLSFVLEMQWYIMVIHIFIPIDTLSFFFWWYSCCCCTQRTINRTVWKIPSRAYHLDGRFHHHNNSDPKKKHCHSCSEERQQRH